MGAALGATLVAAGYRLYEYRAHQRIPSQGSLDDPQVACAFDWVSRRPQITQTV